MEVTIRSQWLQYLPANLRTCEYDDEVLEYWVNTRTSGELTKEDLEEISQSKEYEGEGGEDLEFKPAVVDSGFDFAVDDPFIHRSPVQSDAGSKPAARIKTIVCACVIWNIQR